MIGNVHPKKYLGQHFLIDENISKKIIDSVDFSKYDKVIEVGPGKGALTKYLLYLKDVLTLIEIDKESILFLENEFKKENLEILEKDFLKFDVLSTYPSLSEILIIGNFPYNISSQILFKAIDNYKSISCLVGMFQKEVAERIISKHNTKKYGILSVKTQLLYDVKILFNVSPNVFFPKSDFCLVVTIPVKKIIIASISESSLKPWRSLVGNRIGIGSRLNCGGSGERAI